MAPRGEAELVPGLASQARRVTSPQPYRSAIPASRPLILTRRLGVTRQSIIKLWIAEGIDRPAGAGIAGEQGSSPTAVISSSARGRAGIGGEEQGGGSDRVGLRASVLGVNGGAFPPGAA